ncbi:hypothetical protein [Hoylesella shahii]|uniref:hypothetical protein n=1 Tax=Hoylesella shahii TaxID=228603 RepID=UPI001CAF1AC3|nr:hypothetical protein [Hoylesella shahii]MBF1575774.1 hypothetical protein [Hoylesella shahii]
MTEKEEMKGFLVKELAKQLIANTLSIEQALTLVINSETYEKLMNDATKLYYQSPGYVFSFLQTELQTGKMG